MENLYSNEVKIKYGGKPNEINIKTLLKSLTSITTTIEEINNEVGEGQKLDIKIKALEKGSFLVHLDILASRAVDLIASIELKDTALIVSMLVGILKLRKFLKGKEPEKVEEQNENVILTTGSGNNITIDKRIYNTYNNNTKVNESISENFEALSSDSTIDSFEILDPEQNSLFEAPREEFEQMSVKKVLDTPEDKKRIVTQLVTLNTIKIVWDKGRKWEFIYRGYKISADIADESFFERIKKGETFSMGDTLEVELQINQEFDDIANTFVNKSYTITRVINHNPKLEQGSLFKE